MIVVHDGQSSTLRHIAEVWACEQQGGQFGLSADVEIHLRDLQNLIDGPNSDLLVAHRDDQPVGYLGLISFASPIGSQQIANEHCWYVLPEYRARVGVRLLRAARRWARKHGCTHLLLNASRLASGKHDEICRLYKAIGARHFETTYIMEI